MIGCIDEPAGLVRLGDEARVGQRAVRDQVHRPAQHPLRLVPRVEVGRQPRPQVGLGREGMTDEEWAALV